MEVKDWLWSNMGNGKVDFLEYIYFFQLQLQLLIQEILIGVTTANIEMHIQGGQEYGS